MVGENKLVFRDAGQFRDFSFLAQCSVDAEHPARGGAVDVLAAREGGGLSFLAREPGDDSCFDGGEVADNELSAGRRHEGGADELREGIRHIAVEQCRHIVVAGFHERSGGGEIGDMVLWQVLHIDEAAGPSPGAAALFALAFRAFGAVLFRRGVGEDDVAVGVADGDGIERELLVLHLEERRVDVHAAERDVGVIEFERMVVVAEFPREPLEREAVEFPGAALEAPVVYGVLRGAAALHGDVELDLRVQVLAGQGDVGGEVLAVAGEFVGAAVEVVGALRGEAAAVDVRRDVGEAEHRALIVDGAAHVREGQAGHGERGHIEGAGAVRLEEGAGEVRGEGHLVVEVAAEAEGGGIDVVREDGEVQRGDRIVAAVDGAVQGDAAADHGAAEAACREVEAAEALRVELGVELHAAQQVVTLGVKDFEAAVLEHEARPEPLPLEVEALPLLGELALARRAGFFRAGLAFFRRELRAARLFLRFLCHELHEFVRGRHEVDDHALFLRIVAQAQGDDRVLERDALDGVPRDAAGQHVERAHFEGAGRDEEHDVIRFVAPDQIFEDDVAVEVRVDPFGGDGSGEQVLAGHLVVEDLRGAERDAFREQGDEQQEAEAGSEETVAPAELPEVFLHDDTFLSLIMVSLYYKRDGRAWFL